MTIDEAIAAIRNNWAIPIRSVPELRAILEELKAAGPALCGKRAWPYTENNVCVLKSGHTEPRHQDALGRRFDHSGYDR